MSKYVDRVFESCECNCDECGYTTIVDSTDYGEVNKELRDDNWIIKKINEDWYDFCSEKCYENYINSEGIVNVEF